ncbi:glycosyltransferase [Actinomadura roseirufa]|uniref:glycosyltransferase n=1 Tax=Actinomadura roseirufa TaxID=2094049 RepID=UPI0013F1628A|nr:galactosyltransferase-related protein [Actinomadura roseirufa]
MSRHWLKSGRLHERVATELRRLPDASVRSLGMAAMADPRDAKAYRAFVRLLTDRLSGDDRDGRYARMIDAAWKADSKSRIGYHIGGKYSPASPRPSYRRSIGRPLTDRTRPAGDVPLLVVIPFRDDHPDKRRLRNLLACLQSLHDQSCDRASYRIVVVEADTRPRWGDVLREHSDIYLFAQDAGAFNKSWAINVGVVNAGCRAEILCVLDADCIVDRSFIERNLERFQHSGRQVHLPYRDALYLDAQSSGSVIQARCARGEPGFDLESLRGFLLRRTMGACIWLRADIFRQVGGFDERFVGWGGEDIDFMLRLHTVSSVDRYDDDLLHLDHGRPEMSARGVVARGEIAALSWPADATIGVIAHG